MSEWTYSVARAGLWASAARINIHAQNIANVNTVGYKPMRRAIMTGIINEFYGITRPVGISTGSLAIREYEIHFQGGFREGTSPVNMAIMGKGFFAVMDEAGNVFYTRDGSFSVDVDGYLVDSEGMYVLDVNNRPINLRDMDIEKITVDERGNIWYEDNVVATVGVFYGNSTDDFIKMGNNKYVAAGAVFLLQNGYNILGGYIENSSVDLAEEMTSLLEAQRAYQFAARSLRNADEMIQTSINMRG